MKISRRNLLAAGGSTAIIAIAGSARWTSAQAPGQQAETSPDLIVHNAKVTTLQGGRPEAEAFAVRGERITAVGSTAEMLRLRAPNTRLIDAGSRRVIPGLNDSHFHIVRGGRDYNLELRWDGVESLHRGLQMIAEQAARTPKGGRAAAAQCDRAADGADPHRRSHPVAGLSGGGQGRKEARGVRLPQSECQRHAGSAGLVD